MDVREQLRRTHPIGVNAYYGIVSRTLSDFQSEAYVTLPDYEPGIEWGPCRWQSRDDTTGLRQGDQCLVVFDNRRNPWIIAWWPF